MTHLVVAADLEVVPRVGFTAVPAADLVVAADLEVVPRVGFTAVPAADQVVAADLEVFLTCFDTKETING